MRRGREDRAMKDEKWKSLVGTFAALLLAVCVNRGFAQEVSQQPDAQSISRAGLLPVYGVDFAFDVWWVDGARFPSQSANYSSFGVSAFQKVWDSLSASGFNVIRFPVDVRDRRSSAMRVANLCEWAKSNNVRLVPILVGADPHRKRSRFILGPSVITWGLRAI